MIATAINVASESNTWAAMVSLAIPLIFFVERCRSILFNNFEIQFLAFLILDPAYSNLNISFQLKTVVPRQLIDKLGSNTSIAYN